MSAFTEARLAEKDEQIAALQALVARMGDLTAMRHGSKLDRLDAIAMASVSAPSRELDRVKREAAADALLRVADEFPGALPLGTSERTWLRARAAAIRAEGDR